MNEETASSANHCQLKQMEENVAYVFRKVHVTKRLAGP